jgi:rod shape-determining protein MreB
MFKLFRFASQDMAIDLGTANTVVYVRGQGIVLNEPSVVAIETHQRHQARQGRRRRRQADDGQDPRQHRGDPPLARRRHRRHRRRRADDQALHPQGARQAADASATPEIVICVPSGSTSVERRAIRDAASNAGASAGVADRGADGRRDRRRHACDRTDRLDGRRYRRRHHRSRGALAARPRLHHLGARRRRQDGRSDRLLCPPTPQPADRRSDRRAHQEGFRHSRAPADGVGQTIHIKGRDLVNGVPKEISINQAQIAEALSEPIGAIVEGVRIALENTAPELAADIVDQGIVLTGGGALIAGARRTCCARRPACRSRSPKIR